jgi:hypothetical protein
MHYYEAAKATNCQHDLCGKIRGSTAMPEKKRKVNEGKLKCIAGFAGHRARVPPDPIPNSEVKPCSVPNCSVVFGHVNLGKLATHLNVGYTKGDLAKLYN